MKFRINAIGLTVAAAVVLTACGGGGDSTTPAATPSTFGGTAAVGFPIVGAVVKVTCAGGNALTSQPTSSTGAWQVTLSGQTFPCAAQVTGGTINSVTNTTPYHSIALTTGILNVTPLTDLIVANMARSATLSTWFAALISSALAQIDAAAVTTATNLVQTQLNLAQLGTSVNPMTTPFTPAAGSVMDDTLTALRTALANASLTHANLLTQASAGSSFTAPTGFATRIGAAYMGTTSGTTAAGSGAVGTSNTTTGTATNGTPTIARANCSALNFGANNYTRCSANAIANFSVSMIDATDHQTCTASYSNGTLTVSKGQLSVASSINGDLVDSMTTFGSGAAEKIATLQSFTLGGNVASAISVSTSSLQWNAAGALKNIQGQSQVGSNAAQQLSCTQP